MIEVKNLSKRYGQHLAVKNLSFSVASGEIVGFLGPNGAGKSTTMNMLTGYIAATSGDVTINGFNMLDEPEKCKQHIGYLPETPPVYGDMKVDEYLDFVADIKKVKKSEKSKVIADVKKSVFISDMSDRLIKNMSKGYRQRLGLAQAMIGDPKVLILDEPTVGLDPKQIIEIRDVIKNLGKKHTVLLSSHILSEVSAVCDRVMIINKGEIVASDTPEGLSKSLTHGHKILVRVKGEQAQISNALRNAPMTILTEFEGSREANTWDVVMSAVEDEDIREIIFTCMAANKLPILSMKSLDLSLEEIFLQMTETAVSPTEETEKTQKTEETQETEETQNTEQEESEGGNFFDSNH